MTQLLSPHVARRGTAGYVGLVEHLLHAVPRPGQLLLAAAGQRLAALPQRHRLVEAEPAGLQRPTTSASSSRACLVAQVLDRVSRSPSLLRPSPRRRRRPPGPAAGPPAPTSRDRARARARPAPRRRAARPRSRGPAWPRAERRQPRPDVLRGRWSRRSSPRSTAARAAARSRSISTWRGSRPRRGSASTGRCAQRRRSSRCSRSTQPASARRARSRSPAIRAVSSAQVRHEPPAGLGGGGAAQVGDVVDQRGVGLVPDRRDHRGAAGGDGAAQRLVGERQQVLDAAAAAGQHDHVDRRVAVERAERVDDLRHGQRALDGGVLDPEPHRRPAGRRVRHDVVLGGRRPAGDQPDAVGQERQPPLAGGVEQALGGQQLAQPLDAGQQLADADRADLVDAQARACRGRGRTTACRARSPGCPRRPPARRRAPARSGAVSCSDTSAAGSRSTRNAVPVPGRAVTWASWPSTHTAPSRSTHSAILRATVRTGHGCSGESEAGSFALGDRGDPVGQHRDERRAVAVGVLPRQERPQVVEREVAQPAAQLGDGQRRGSRAAPTGPAAASPRPRRPRRPPRRR